MIPLVFGLLIHKSHNHISCIIRILLSRPMVEFKHIRVNLIEMSELNSLAQYVVQTDDPTCCTGSCIPCFKRFLISAQAKVVCSLLANNIRMHQIDFDKESISLTACSTTERLKVK